MTGAAQDKRLLAVQGLQARIHMAPGHLVVDLHGHVHFHAAQSVDDILEAVEVDLGVVGNGHAGHLGHGLDGAGRLANGVGGVQLLGAVAVDLDLGIAMERHHGDLLVLRINAGEDHGVGAVGITVLVGVVALFGLIGAQQQHVEGAAVVFRRLLEGLLNFLGDADVELGLDLADIGEGHADTAQGNGQYHGQHAQSNATTLLAATVVGVIIASRGTRIGIHLGRRQQGRGIGLSAIQGRLAIAHRLGMTSRTGRRHRLRMTRSAVAHRLRGMSSALSAGVVIVS